MKKNSLKKTAVLTLAICFGLFCEKPANAIDERVPIKSKRQLEYPALPQGKKNCEKVAQENRDLYWKKKGVFYDAKMGKFSFGLDCEKFKSAEQFMNAIYEWLDEDDNGYIDVTLLTKRGHAVAVDSIFKEEKRYLMVICSWGEKFVIEIPRPVLWIVEEGRNNMIVGCRVVGGDPKIGRYLYDKASGSERGPNQVTMQIGSAETMLPKEVAQKTTDLFLECLELEKPLPEDQLPPICKMLLKVDPTAKVMAFGLLVDKYKNDPGFRKKVEAYRIKMRNLGQPKASASPTDGKVLEPPAQKTKSSQKPQVQQSSTETKFEKFSKPSLTPSIKGDEIEIYISGGKEIKNQHTNFKSKTLY